VWHADRSSLLPVARLSITTPRASRSPAQHLSSRGTWSRLPRQPRRQSAIAEVIADPPAPGELGARDPIKQEELAPSSAGAGAGREAGASWSREGWRPRANSGAWVANDSGDLSLRTRSASASNRCSSSTPCAASPRPHPELHKNQEAIEATDEVEDSWSWTGSFTGSATEDTRPRSWPPWWNDTGTPHSTTATRGFIRLSGLPSWCAEHPSQAPERGNSVATPLQQGRPRAPHPAHAGKLRSTLSCSGVPSIASHGEPYAGRRCAEEHRAVFGP